MSGGVAWCDEVEARVRAFHADGVPLWETARSVGVSRQMVKRRLPGLVWWSVEQTARFQGVWRLERELGLAPPPAGVR